MTKIQLLKLLEPYHDNAVVFVSYFPNVPETEGEAAAPKMCEIVNVTENGKMLQLNVYSD